MLTFVQTNALPIDDEWINIFKKYKISVGVSIDGTKKFHDMYRIDKKGNGSYEKTVEKLKVLKRAFDAGMLKNVGTLTVVNKEYNATEIYKNFRQVLGLEGFDFLLPDYTHNSFQGDSLIYGRFLCLLLDAWFQEKNSKIQIRFITSYLFQMMGKKISTRADIIPQYDKSQTITVSSDGDLNVDDTLLGTCNNDFKIGYTIYKNTLKKFINHDIFKSLYASSSTLPKECISCKWKNICRGGQLIHRYSHKNGFKNKSIMCEGLMLYYDHMYNLLIKHGYSASELNKNLSI